jgi:hypothetical protein
LTIGEGDSTAAAAVPGGGVFAAAIWTQASNANGETIENKSAAINLLWFSIPSPFALPPV